MSKHKPKKIRRNSGRIVDVIYDPVNMPYERVLWNDWMDYRDGFRNIGSDLTKIQPSFINREHWGWKNRNKNEKLKRQLEIRKAMKERYACMVQ